MFKKNERGKDGNKFNPFHRVLKQNLLKKKKKKSSRTKIKELAHKTWLQPQSTFCFFWAQN